MAVRFGPGMLVAAAFVGPGTVTTATVAGAGWGYTLLWALLFATLATIVLQDMAVRLGVVGRRGLAEALLEAAGAPWRRVLAGLLVLVALGVGNAAYQAGNLTGGALGLTALTGGAVDPRLWVGLLAGLALVAVVFGRYRQLERLLVFLVVLMSAAFLVAAVLSRPDPAAILRGLVPIIPDGAVLLTAALVGTTIVPYNLFLHAAAARQRWTDDRQLTVARIESLTSVSLGGLVSMLILVSAAGTLFQNQVQVQGAAGLVGALEPTFGPAAHYLIGVGLFAAGFTSAVTAPLAASWVAAELWPRESRRALVSGSVGAVVVLSGAANALLGIQPLRLIIIAQFANALLLPLITVFLLVVMNRRRLLGTATNRTAANLAGAVVVAATVALGARSLWALVG